MHPVGLRSRCHENRQGRQPQDVHLYAPAGEPGDSVQSSGTEHDGPAIPLPWLLRDSACNVLLQHRTGVSLRWDARQLQRMDRLAHEILCRLGRLDREDTGHSRHLPNVQHPHAGIVRRCHLGDEAQGGPTTFEWVNGKEQTVPQRRTSVVTPSWPPRVTTGCGQSPGWSQENVNRTPATPWTGRSQRRARLSLVTPAPASGHS